MRVINMLEDFKLFYEDIQKSGKWEAFLKYYEKYKDLFDSMVKGLYRIDFESFKILVEQTDIEAIFREIERVDLKVIDDIKQIVKKSVENLQFQEEFDLYIGAGLGHVGGTALPSNPPLVYFGLECFSRCDLKFLIPHEVNHMVRIRAFEQINMDSFLERVITEGLGVMYPLAHNNLPVNIDTICKTIIITPNQAKVLLEKEQELFKEVAAHFDEKLDYELSNTFFTGYTVRENKPILSGYYVGLKIVERAMSDGNSIETLTRLPCTEFIKYI